MPKRLYAVIAWLSSTSVYFSSTSTWCGNSISKSWYSSIGKMDCHDRSAGWRLPSWYEIASIPLLISSCWTNFDVVVLPAPGMPSINIKLFTLKSFLIQYLIEVCPPSNGPLNRALLSESQTTSFFCVPRLKWWVIWCQLIRFVLSYSHQYWKCNQ